MGGTAYEPGERIRYHKGGEDMDEEIRDTLPKRKNPFTGRTSKVTTREKTAPVDQAPRGSPDFTETEDINPLEPWILRDPDEKGLVRRHWRRKQVEG
jgi:hypothetical protein